MHLHLPNGDSCPIAAQPVASGGEASLHRVEGRPGLLAKVYHKPASQARAQHLQYLLENKPDKVEEYVAWPQALLYKGNGQLAGYVVEERGGVILDMLCGPQLPPQAAVQFAAFARQDGPLNRNLAAVAYNTAKGLQLLHDAGYVAVDLKASNILVRPDASITLLDVDSFRPEGAAWPADETPVYTPEYAPPEMEAAAWDPQFFLRRTWDRFGLAVLFYKLFLGIHPFTASGHKPPFQNLTTVDQLIGAGLYVHGKQAGKTGTVPPPHRHYHKLPPSLKLLFERALEAGAQIPALRPTAQSWAHVLLRHLNAQKPLSFSRPKPLQWEPEEQALYLADANAAGLLEPFGRLDGTWKKPLPVAAYLKVELMGIDARMAPFRQELSLSPPPLPKPAARPKLPRETRIRSLLLALLAVAATVALLWAWRTMSVPAPAVFNIITVGAGATAAIVFLTQDRWQYIQKVRRLRRTFEAALHKLMNDFMVAKSAHEQQVEHARQAFARYCQAYEETCRPLAEFEQRAVRLYQQQQEAQAQAHKETAEAQARLARQATEHISRALAGFDKGFSIERVRVKGFGPGLKEALFQAQVRHLSDIADFNPKASTLVLAKGREAKVPGVGEKKLQQLAAAAAEYRRLRNRAAFQASFEAVPGEEAESAAMEKDVPTRPYLEAVADYGRLHDQLTSTDLWLSSARQAWENALAALPPARQSLQWEIMLKMGKLQEFYAAELEALPASKGYETDYARQLEIRLQALLEPAVVQR